MMISANFQIVATYLICAGIIIPCFSIQDTDLFPYEEAEGSTRLVFRDDEKTEVFFTSGFKLFNQTYRSVVISGNGIAAFQPANVSLPHSPDIHSCKESNSQYHMIMPFWSDLYAISGSKLTYMETSRHVLLAKAGKDIIAAFPLFRRTRLGLSWLFTVTWKDVVPCCEDSSHPRKNTFQLVLAKGDSHSFALLYYSRMNWVNDHDWVAGFDFGFSQRPHVLQGSCRGNGRSLGTSSNINDDEDNAGKWVFGVESSLILPHSGRVTEPQQLSIQPNVISIMGNVPIVIRSPILDYANITLVTCSFQDPSRPRPSEVTCSVVNIDSDADSDADDGPVICMVPFLYSLGKIDINLLIKYGPEYSGLTSMMFKGYIYVVKEHELEETLPQINFSRTADAEVLLSAKWDPSSITLENIKKIDIDGSQTPFQELIQLVLLEYRRDTWNEIGPATLPFLNNGHYLSHLNMSGLNRLLEKGGNKPYPRAFALKASYSLKTGEEMHKLLPFLVTTSTDLITSEFQMGNMITNTSSGNIYDSYCKTWHEKEPHPPIHLDTLPCPRTVEQAENDWRFSHDRLDPSHLQILNPGASTSYSQNVPSPSGYGSQCAYDIQGDLIKSIPGVGRLQRHSPNGRMNYWAHYLQDTLPYLYCCRWSSFKEGNCVSYYFSKRPTNQGGRNYSPPYPSRLTGLAHVSTFPGLNYTLVGVGEAWMVKYSSDDERRQGSSLPSHSAESTEFKMQARVGPFYSVEPGEIVRNASVVIAAVMENIKDEKTVKLEVSVGPPGRIKVFMDGERISRTGINASPIYTLYNDGVALSFKSWSHLVASFSSGFSASFMTSPGSKGTSLHIVITAPSQAVKHCEGLLFEEFTVNLNVARSESLFSYPDEDHYEGDYLSVISDSNNDTNTLPNGEYTFCKGVQECNYDFSRTYRSSFVETARSAYQLYQHVLKAAGSFRVECTRPNDLENGQINITSLTVGSTLRAACDSGYVLNINLSNDDDATFTCANDVDNTTNMSESAQWINLKSNWGLSNFSCIMIMKEPEDVIAQHKFDVGDTTMRTNDHTWRLGATTLIPSISSTHDVTPNKNKIGEKSPDGVDDDIKIDLGLIIFTCCVLITVIILAVVVAECTYCRPLRMYFVNRFRPIPRYDAGNEMELF